MTVANVDGQGPALHDCSRVAVRRVRAAHRAAATTPLLSSVSVKRRFEWVWRLTRAYNFITLHFFPNAAFLPPVVKGFAVDLVNGRFRNGQFAGLYRHKEINVIDFSVSAFHINTGEVLIAAKIR